MFFFFLCGYIHSRDILSSLCVFNVISFLKLLNLCLLETKKPQNNHVCMCCRRWEKMSARFLRTGSPGSRFLQFGLCLHKNFCWHNHFSTSPFLNPIYGYLNSWQWKQHTCTCLAPGFICRNLPFPLLLSLGHVEG